MGYLMRSLAIVLVISAVTGAFAAGAAPPAPPTRADIEKAAAAITGYDLGKPRGPLTEVERLVLATHGRAALRQHLEAQLVKALDAATTDEARLFICEQLKVIGTDACVPALGNLLADEKKAHMACLALGTNPSPKAAAALRDALGQARGKALLAVISTLGGRRDEASVDALAKFLSGDDAAAAEAAASALGRIGGAEAASALAKARMGADARRRAVITDGYLACADRLLAAGNEKDAAAIFKELMVPNEPRLVRRGALVGLLSIGGPEAVALVISTLSGDDAAMKATAIAAVRTLKGQGVSERFTAELPKLPADLQVLLIGALADREDPSARSAMAAAARSESAGVRLAAVKALAKVGDASSVALLARAVESGAAEEKRAATVSLLMLRGDGVDAAIVESMKAARSEARVQLIQVLHDRGAASAAPAILNEAAGQDATVRAAALKALSRLAEPKDLPAILDVLVGLAGDDGRDEAEGAALAAARRITDEAARADAALAAMRSAGSPAAKGSLLRVLRGIASAKALDAVQAAAKDTDPKVQDAAIRALADWPDQRPLPVLTQILRTTANDTQRVVALRGCVRLLGMVGAATAETVKAYADLMQGAKRPEEKKLVLAGLANLGHPAALGMAESLMADEAVGAEARLALISVARAIMGSYREEVCAAMTRLASTTKDADIKRQAQEIARQVDRLGEYLAAWQVSGPYAESGKNYLLLFDTVFPPEKPGSTGLEWRALPVPEVQGGPVVFDLLKAVGGQECVAYVRTWIHSDKAQDARLEAGVDDGIKIWLNGQVVLAANRGGKCVPEEFRADVSLRQGANPLLVKVTQSTGPWAFCIRLVKRDGKRLEGVRADCNPK